MLTPPTQHIHPLRYAREYRHSPAAWAEAFGGVDWARAECLSDKPKRTVWRAVLDLPGGPEELVIKVHAHRSAADSLRSVLHLGRLRRQWRGAARLSRRGFRVARGLALLRGRLDNGPCDVLVMESAPGVPLIDLLARDDLPTRTGHAVARQLGELVSLLDGERLHSKDLKPSNLLVDTGGDEATITIIDSDTVGHRPGHPLLPLVLEPLGLGVLPRRTLLARVVKSWAWHEWLNAPYGDIAERETGERAEHDLARRAWAEIEARVRVHGDPTPEHDPLNRGTPRARALDGPGR